jgi:hypothetical protein
MKWNAFAVATVVAAITFSCDNKSSEKETTNLVDTVVNTVDTTALETVDSTAIIAAKVPAKTKESFEKKYPQAKNVKWVEPKTAKEEKDPEMDEPDHKVWFHWQGSDHQGGYDKDGNWVKTTNEIKDPASLPAAVNNTVKKEYSGYTVRSVTKEEDKDGISYEIKLEKGDEKVKLEISESGKVLKRKVL